MSDTGDELMRAAGYARVSTETQAAQGFSLGEQERRLREFIATHNARCIGVYIDAGVSGRRADKRPELQRMLRDAEAGAFDVLVIPSLDRLGRNTRDLYEIMARLDSLGVAVRSLRGDVDTSSATGKLQTQIMASLAEFESNLIGERTSAGKAASVRAGRRNGGPRPFGYAQRDGQLVLIPAEAAVLRRMRDEVLAGRSMREIAAGLNRDGITTVRGARWSQARISDMLANRLYVGKVNHYNEEFDGEHEPVFAPDEWADAQVVLSARRARPGKGRGRQPHMHLFGRGMLRCGYCGAAIAPRRTRNTQGRVYERYRCFGQLSGSSPDCTLPSYARATIDAGVLDYFAAVGLDLEETRRRLAGNVEQAVAQTRATLAHAERQQALADERLGRVKRDYQDGKLDADDWHEQRDELRAEHDAAAAEVERLAARVEEVAGQGALLDSEHELLLHLAELRRAVAGRVTDSTTIEGMRAALLRLFDGFTLHSFDEPEITPELPEGWVRSALYTHPDLMVAGADGLIIEPHPRREMILDANKEAAFPELRRVPLEARVRMQASRR